MKYILGKNHWRTAAQGEETCFLLTNGLGGFSSLAVSGACGRGDHALLMGAKTAPNVRVHMVTNVHETLTVDGKSYTLAAQQYVNRTKNQNGCQYLDTFCFEYLPQWTYRAGGVTVKKTIVMPHFQNIAAVFYEIEKPEAMAAELSVTPLLRMTAKDERLSVFDHIVWDETEENCLVNKDSGLKLYFEHNGNVTKQEASFYDDLYFQEDAACGRDAYGIAFVNHSLVFRAEGEISRFYVIYSMDKIPAAVTDCPECLMKDEIERKAALENAARVSLPAAKALALAADAFIVKRESTKEMSIIAGYPFFGDWGRDTMIALPGCTLATGRYEEAKSILNSFMAYCHKGLMPNLFPEGGAQPLYNTVDAALLFINAVYLYYKETNDKAFLDKALPVMRDIIEWYKKGTDFNIHMDDDGLIAAGSGLWQVTWMDVRWKDILPTPRHGKPVEINAYWYNALMIMSALDEETGEVAGRLAQKVKKSFCEKFWNEDRQCLKDVLSGAGAASCDVQIRCNQIWALSLPFIMPDEAQARKIIETVKRELYTPWGLRSLAPTDEQFHPFYGGSQYERDMAYHQGTVWAFPLGAYYVAKLRFAENKKAAAAAVLSELEAVTAAMSEGCLGQIAEVYDGLTPDKSKGCFAQGWSVGEILWAYKKAEETIF